MRVCDLFEGVILTEIQRVKRGKEIKGRREKRRVRERSGGEEEALIIPFEWSRWAASNRSGIKLSLSQHFLFCFFLPFSWRWGFCFKVFFFNRNRQ